MKGGLAAAAVAALAGSANAALPHHRMAHNLFKKGEAASVCVPSCTTIWTTITGEPTLVPGQWKTTSAPPPPPPAPTTTSADKTTTVEVVVVPVPTPQEYKCPTTGVYTFPATTVTITESTTVCVGQTTKLPAGTHTIGGVTTAVDQPTTVTCPYAKETEHNGVKTSVIETTVYVCPSAGTYTIAPITTVCAEETKVVYPVPTSYAPGTYTAPQQVVTVTETDYVYVCPYTTPGLPTTKAPEPTYVGPAPVVTTKAEEPKKETPEAPKAETTKEATKETTNKKTSSGGSLQGSGDHYGITYTPYVSSNGDCKDAATVKKDLQDLKSKGFQIIRSYSTDCDTLTSVGDACAELGLELIIGVFVKNTGCTYETAEIKKQVDAIASWNNFGHVKLFVVGNEAIMNGFCKPDQLATLLETVKSKVSGYTGPYTIAETLNIWQREDVKSALCGGIDVTGANIHPYFNADVSPEKAGTFVQGQMDLLKDICPGSKDVINLECGWPSEGNCNGVACPGKEAQATAIQSIREVCGDKTVFFSYENDEWKQPGECGCERSWGCKDAFN